MVKEEEVRELEYKTINLRIKLDRINCQFKG